jgi:hypothetical protein
MLKKTTLILIAVFVGDSFKQYVLAVLFFTSYMCLQLFVKPYRDRIFAWMEVGSCVCCYLTLMLAKLEEAEEHTSSSSSWSGWSIGIIFINVSFVVLFLVTQRRILNAKLAGKTKAKVRWSKLKKKGLGVAKLVNAMNEPSVADRVESNAIAMPAVPVLPELISQPSTEEPSGIELGEIWNSQHQLEPVETELEAGPEAGEGSTVYYKRCTGDGHVYYENSVTLETFWTLPSDGRGLAQVAPTTVEYEF